MIEPEMELATLLQAHQPRSVDGSVSQEIDLIVSDSRLVRPGALFVAIRGGQEQDRHKFVADAVARGASAVVVEDDQLPASGATRIVVDDTRLALARMAARLHGEPSSSLCCVGVTGTNGKSTTALLLQQVLSQADAPAAYLGTLGFDCGNGRDAIANTTPEAGQLQQMLAQARDAGCRSVAMEVSSHGLALQRVEAVEFRAAVFTNLTRDHLDFHGTEEDYFAAKSLLFQNLSNSAVAVLNADDMRSAQLAQMTQARVVRFGLEPGPEIHLQELHMGAGRTALTIATPDGPLEVETALTGRFNCSNVVAAVATGIALGIDRDNIHRGIAAVPSIPGRFERVDAGQSFQVIVDYAHTPAGLETVLSTARELTSRRLLCLFGCGGDRDPGKRPMMGRVAEQLADRIYLTSDNPRSESPEQIIDQIVAGMSAADGLVIEPDRFAAIHAVLRDADDGDVVVLAGKGDEPYQILDGGRVVPFDDRDVARQALGG